MLDASGNSQPETAVQAALRPPDTASERSRDRWQWQLAQAIRSLPTLLARLKLSADRIGVSETAAATFPLLVTESYVSRMKPGDPTDPLLLQVVPQSEEMRSPPEFTDDPVSDADARSAPGLLQKYAGRALLITTGACAIHCRYCFRREYPYSTEPRSLSEWQPALDAIAADSSIDEVLLSGGDPLTLTDQRLETLVEHVAAISHIRRIRFHTRLPIVLPSRLTEAFLNLVRRLREHAVTPVMVVHANHAHEIVGDCEAALAQLVASGITTLNQAVLLKGVNDSVDAQVELSRRLVNAGVIPYYLHQLDRARGTHHFEVAPDIGRQIVNGMAAQLPGYAVPRYVQEIPEQAGKTWLL